MLLAQWPPSLTPLSRSFIPVKRWSFSSLFPVHALAMDKRFCHAKNIMKKYRKTLLHAFSELGAVVLTVLQKIRTCPLYLDSRLYLVDIMSQFISDNIMHKLFVAKIQINIQHNIFTRQIYNLICKKKKFLFAIKDECSIFLRNVMK